MFTGRVVSISELMIAGYDLRDPDDDCDVWSNGLQFVYVKDGIIEKIIPV